MIKFPSGFAVVLLAVTLVLGVVIYSPWTPRREAEHPDAVAIATTYTIAVRDAVSVYRALGSPAAAKVLEAKLMMLTVPSERRDFHLDLVLALHAYGNTSSKDAKKLEAAKNRVQGLLDAQAWLN